MSFSDRDLAALMEERGRGVRPAPFAFRALRRRAGGWRRRIADSLAQRGRRPLELGVLTYLAVAEDQSPHRSSAACRRIRIRLRVTAAADEDAFRRGGLAGLRRQRLSRLATQAQAQGALLTVEDLALLTCSSPATVKRDLARLGQEGHAPPLRRRTGRQPAQG